VFRQYEADSAESSGVKGLSLSETEASGKKMSLRLRPSRAVGPL